MKVPQPLEPQEQALPHRRSLAPLFYFLGEILILAILCWRYPPLRDPGSALFYLFWIIAILTFTFFILTAIKKPGYVSNSFFTTNAARHLSGSSSENKNLSHAPILIQQNMMSPRELNIVMPKPSTNQRKALKKGAIGSRSGHFEENIDQSTSNKIPFRQPSENNVCGASAENSFSFNDREYRNESGNARLLSNMGSRNQQKLAALYTPQFEKQKRVEKNYPTDIDSNNNMINSLKILKFEEESKNKNNSTAENNIPKQQHLLNTITMSNATVDEKCPHIVSEKIPQYQFLDKNGNLVGNSPTFTQNYQSNVVSNQASARSTVAPIAIVQTEEKKTSNTPRLANELLKQEEIGIHLQTSEKQKKNTIGDERLEVENEDEICKEEKIIEDKLAEISQKCSMRKNSSIGINSSARLEDKKENIILANQIEVQSNYCTVCKIVQPLRCKHCKACDKCVATFDHHCTWIGNCIGEKNRKIFLIYILVQFIHCFWALISICLGITKESSVAQWICWNWFMIVIVLIAGYFTIFLAILITFHGFMIMNNLTTWEALSWEKITYMLPWLPKYGSPFDKGIIANLKEYWCSEVDADTFREWNFPLTLPENAEPKSGFVKCRACWKRICS